MIRLITPSARILRDDNDPRWKHGEDGYSHGLAAKKKGFAILRWDAEEGYVPRHIVWCDRCDKWHPDPLG